MHNALRSWAWVGLMKLTGHAKVGYMGIEVVSAGGLQALLWARKVRAFLAKLPSGRAGQRGQEEVQQKEEPQQQLALQADDSSPEGKQQEEASVTKVQERLLDAVEAAAEEQQLDEAAPPGGTATPYHKRPLLSGLRPSSLGARLHHRAHSLL
jgi:hypothetical protein